MDQPDLSRLLESHLVGVRRVVDTDGRWLDTAHDLGLPSDVAYAVLDLTDPVGAAPGEGDLFIGGVSGAGEADAGVEEEEALGSLQALGPGARFCLFVAVPTDEAALDRLAQAFVAARCRVTALAGIDLEQYAAAAVGERIADEPLPGPEGPPAGWPSDRLALENRAALASLPLIAIRRASRAAVAHLEPDEREAAREVALALRRAEDRIAEIRASKSFKIGGTVMAAAGSPRRLTVLPRDVYRLWRGPSGGRTVPYQSIESEAALTRWYASVRTSPERLFLAHSAGAGRGRTRLVIGGILRDETAAALDPDADVQRLSPHDALVVLENTDPDLVLVETGAFGAGNAWAPAGDPTAVDRDRTLLMLLDAARSFGRPMVLWRSHAVPNPVALETYAHRFSLVLDETEPGGATAWGPGVQLARFNPIGRRSGSSGPFTYVGAWDRRAPLTTRRRFAELLGAAASSGLEIRVDARSIDGRDAFPSEVRTSISDPLDPIEAAEVYRDRPVVVADPFPSASALSRLLEAIACGARIVGLADPSRAAIAPRWTVAVAAGDDPASRLREARDAGELDPGEMAEALRELFAHRAVPVALADLSRRLGGLRPDPLAGRAIAVLADLPVGGEATPFVDGILRQTLTPHEIVLAGGVLPDRARQAIAAAGITVREAGSPAGAMDGSPATRWAALTALSPCPWVIAWPVDRDVGKEHLRDLAAWAESSRADAVGYAADGANVFVSDLPVAGSLIRRALLTRQPGAMTPALDDAGFAPLARRGVRLFGVRRLPTGGGR